MLREAEELALRGHRVLALLSDENAGWLPPGVQRVSWGSLAPTAFDLQLRREICEEADFLRGAVRFAVGEIMNLHCRMYRNLLGPTTCNSACTNASAGSASGAGSDDRDASSCSGGRDGVLAYLAALSPPLDLVVCDSITAPGFYLAGPRLRTQ